MKKLRWGIIGYGDIVVKRVGPALRTLENCEVIAISRQNVNLLEASAKEVGAKRWYANWEELLQDDEIDAVYIATPVSLHAEQAIAAAKAKKHILCEKPMAMNIEECDKMIQAAKENNVYLNIAYYRHFYPVISRIKEIIKSGEIGKVVLGQINAFEWFDRKLGEPRYWLLNKSISGGGPMMDFGIHRIEVLINLLGPVKNTIGFNSNIFFNREVEDTSSAFFEFENGSRAILTACHAIFEKKDTLDIYGTKGSIHVPILNENKMSVISSEGSRTENPLFDSNIHLPLIEAFANAVLSGKSVPVDGETGREINRIIEDIYRN